MCQGEGGSDSLTLVFMCEDGEEDSVHGGSVLKDAHGPFASEACEQLVEVAAQAGNGFGTGLLPGVGEAAGALSAVGRRAAKKRRPSGRYPSPRSRPSACICFTTSNAIGKLSIVAARCGMGVLL